MIARHPLALTRYVEGATDRNGDPVDAWEPPVTILAYSIGPRGTDEKGNVTTTTGLTVGLPSDYGIGPRDRVTLDGEMWRVDGELVNSNRGPWSWAPGYVLTLERTEG